jgi:hypothetical protein
MLRIAISVEGQTEDEFCKNVLCPYFHQKNILLIPIVVTTKRKKCGLKHKGGCVNLDRVKKEVEKLLSNFDYVTTFYDLYGFDGISEDTTAEELEEEIHNLFSNNTKLIPYIQKYEFETLLFSKPEYYEELLDTRAKMSLQTIVDEFQGEIEAINNSRETAPSKRIMKIFNESDDEYDKVFYGYSICQEIGLSTILDKAPRFKSWIEKITQLAD